MEKMHFSTFQTTFRSEITKKLWWFPTAMRVHYTPLKEILGKLDKLFLKTYNAYNFVSF